MARGPRRTCTTCQADHWSHHEQCPTCRGLTPEIRVKTGRCESCDAPIQATSRWCRKCASAGLAAEGRHPRQAGECKHPNGSKSTFRRRKRGRCLDRYKGDRHCPVRWGPLDHRHCPEPECGRPMGVGADRCSRCLALLILQAPRTAQASAEGRVIRWQPVPTLEDDLEELPPVAMLRAG